MANPILRTTYDFHGKCTDLLHAAKLRHGTDGFTSPPKEGMLRILSPENPRTRVPEASMLTTRPLKPLCWVLLLYFLTLVAGLWSTKLTTNVSNKSTNQMQQFLKFIT
jgi:hypothetical protein